ncbi:DUF6249 domain-containing protein [bacterium]|nr:DUF6249 domain-containing protein [bacterium]
MKNNLILCLMLWASVSTATTVAEEVEVVVSTSENGTETETATKTIVYKYESDSEFDTEVTAIVDEVIGELKSEWKDLDEQERQEIKDALRSVGEGIDIRFDPDMDFSSVLVTIIAILFTVGSPILIVALLLFFSYRKRKQRAALIEKFIDAGKDVPPEVLATFDENGLTSNNLQRGLMLTGIGIALVVILGMLFSWQVASIGLIPICIGIARLLIWKLVKQPTSDAPNSDSAA